MMGSRDQLARSRSTSVPKTKKVKASSLAVRETGRFCQFRNFGGQLKPEAYLPVVMNLTHWPWFLNKGLVNFLQPPFLHCALLVGAWRT